MQWLIDIIAAKVIAEIGIPPVYIDRGDPGAEDFLKGDFTADGNWHELDLSAIVPAGAQAIAFKTTLRANATNRLIQIRKNGNTQPFVASVASTQVALIPLYSDLVVAIDSNRIIEYNAGAFVWLNLNLTIKGWWL